MPAKSLRWSDVFPGAIALAVVLALVFAVLKYARVGRVRGDTVSLFASTGAARGVMAGTTEVWLEGQKVGMVKDVGFRPIGIDSARRIILELEVSKDALRYLRRDSYGQIRAGGNLIGAQVISLSAGTNAAGPITEDDTIPMRGQGDTEAVSAQLALASKEFPAIIANIKTLGTHLDSARGTAGAVLNDDHGARELGRFTGQASGLMTRARSGEGTIGLFMRGDVMARARSAMARADTLRQLVSSGETSIGRFRRDSTLLRQVADTRAELSIVQALLAEPRGTAGRVLADSAAQQELARVTREMGLLFEDVKKNPMRYIAF